MAFIYIVSSVFQVEYPRTPRVTPLPGSGVDVPPFFHLLVFLGVFASGSGALLFSLF